jgi:hypothetical protein
MNNSMVKDAEKFLQRLLMDITGAQRALSTAEAQAELEMLLVSDNPVAPKIILVVDQLHLLATAGEAGAAVLQQLFNWAHAHNSRLVFMGITGRAQLPQGMQEVVQHSLSPTTLTAQAAADIETVIRSTLGDVLHKDAVRQWTVPATGGGSQQLAMQLCLEAVHIAMKDSSSANRVSLKHMELACSGRVSLPVSGQPKWGGVAWMLRYLKLPVSHTVFGVNDVSRFPFARRQLVC